MTVTRPAELELRRVPITHPDAQRLIDEVQAEYVLRYGGPDRTPIVPAAFEPPAGSFFVGYLAGKPIATGAWRRSTVEAFGTTETAEIKRMYVVPTARAAGHARRMLAHLEVTAASAGAKAMVLETGEAQPEAIALYESSGYERVPGFGYYRDEPLNRCFGKLLNSAD
ncbi:GNAT family N-acetyltransferase [Nocardioides sp.]|uniref:GNAT family N-acetyltransferase n=1 Tax=Nocardioides sp. TaxID=35761 RepID=UPI0031FE9C61|nr:GCN5-related N-acetyltransferase [Nocardioides sp.]